MGANLKKREQKKKMYKVDDGLCIKYTMCSTHTFASSSSK